MRSVLRACYTRKVVWRSVLQCQASAAPAGTFCAGADLKERATQTPADILRFSDAARGVIASLAALPVPVVAAVDGAALGGGLELALGADLRVVSPRARLGQYTVHHRTQAAYSWP